MAYNRDAHIPLENEVSTNIADLNARLEKLTTTINEILKGSGTELVGVPAGSLTELEQLDLDSLQDANKQGQTLADLDLIVVYDTSHNILRKTTLASLHNGYLNSKTVQPAGTTNQLQIKSTTGVTASPNLTFKNSNNTLEVNGTITATNVAVSSTLTAPITTITEGAYSITEHDYTVLVDTADNNIVVTLPNPMTCSGRILNLKKIATTNNLTLLCDSGTIDGIGSRVIKNNNSTRTLQSDGNNWWITSKSGT